MKSSMKKKFDFSAEMNEAESIKNTPKNEYWEEEKRLLDVNAKELASLNDNVHEMSINLINLLNWLSPKIRRSKPKNSGNLSLINSFTKFKSNVMKLNVKLARQTTIFSYRIRYSIF